MNVLINMFASWNKLLDGFIIKLHNIVPITVWIVENSYSFKGKLSFDCFIRLFYCLLLCVVIGYLYVILFIAFKAYLLYRFFLHIKSLDIWHVIRQTFSGCHISMPYPHPLWTPSSETPSSQTDPIIAALSLDKRKKFVYIVGSFSRLLASDICFAPRGWNVTFDWDGSPEPVTMTT